MRQLFLLPFYILFSTKLLASNIDFSQREINIGQSNWHVWLDKDAEWENDKLYLPEEVNLRSIPVNRPSIGWEAMYSKNEDSYKLPLVVEEIVCNGDSKKEYHGVSWFYSTLEIPKRLKDKVVRLYIGKFNCRIEIYVNQKLAGYDLVAGTPYSCDISEFLTPGEENKIAFRITNPGGQRGWNDFPLISWGKYNFLPHHDFGGIGGDVILKVTDKVYIEDVFVKNELPAKANNITISTSVINTIGFEGKANLKIDIISNENSESIYSSENEININGQSINPSFTISAPKAKLWSIEIPNLYTCQVTLTSNGITDSYKQTFGFRVFEVKANEKGEENFYLNGKRIRHRSAIDWGYYAHTGYYANDEMARKSVEAAKAIGYNGINFHRNIGEPSVLKYADEKGLMIYEEPGGITELVTYYHERHGKSFITFEAQLAMEKCRRMVFRDRNHPSLMIYNLMNERSTWHLLQKNIMHDMHQLDDSRLIVNQSGGEPGGPAGPIPHVRPYESKFRLDYFDDHTVGSKDRFQEYDFHFHKSANDTMKHGVVGRIDPSKHDNIVYWGEVRCYPGPDNSYKLINETQRSLKQNTSYNANSYSPLSEKMEEYFTKNRLHETGSEVIQSPSDISEQAGRGLMYIDGRLSQIIMANDSEDGFAMNGWSGCSPDLPKRHNKYKEYYSAIVDGGRNLKGPASDFAYWTRELQIAILRQNGKYFKPGENIKLDFTLINEGHIEAGDYNLEIKVKDGAGEYTNFTHAIDFKVFGEDTYAQHILDDFSITPKESWNAGYITIEGKLYKGDSLVAEGKEQVLLQNRKSYKEELQGTQIQVLGWDAAKKAVIETGIEQVTEDNANISLIGSVQNDQDIDKILHKVHDEGMNVILKFNADWANVLYEKGILSEKVIQWGGEQVPFWNGNGWAYIDHLISDQAVPGKSTIGTTGWEVDGDPTGFGPFISNYKQTSYGAFLARPDVLLTLIGEIEYGKGKIVLLPTYPVDEDKAFNDLLFFNTLINYSK